MQRIKLRLNSATLSTICSIIQTLYLNRLSNLPKVTRFFLINISKFSTFKTTKYSTTLVHPEIMSYSNKTILAVFHYPKPKNTYKDHKNPKPRIKCLNQLWIHFVSHH